MIQHDQGPGRTQGYSLASLLLLMPFLAAGMALLRSDVTNGPATKDGMLIAVLLMSGGLVGAGVGLAVALLGSNRHSVPVSLFAGSIAGAFSGGVLVVNIWFPMFLMVGLVLCVVAAIIALTRHQGG